MFLHHDGTVSFNSEEYRVIRAYQLVQRRDALQRALDQNRLKLEALVNGVPDPEPQARVVPLARRHSEAA